MGVKIQASLSTCISDMGLRFLISREVKNYFCSVNICVNKQYVLSML